MENSLIRRSQATPKLSLFIKSMFKEHILLFSFSLCFGIYNICGLFIYYTMVPHLALPIPNVSYSLFIVLFLLSAFILRFANVGAAIIFHKKAEKLEDWTFYSKWSDLLLIAMFALNLLILILPVILTRDGLGRELTICLIFSFLASCVITLGFWAHCQGFTYRYYHLDKQLIVSVPRKKIYSLNSKKTKDILLVEIEQMKTLKQQIYWVDGFTAISALLGLSSLQVILGLNVGWQEQFWFLLGISFLLLILQNLVVSPVQSVSSYLIDLLND